MFAGVQRSLYALGYTAHTLAEAGRFLVSRRRSRVLTLQILFTGVEALPIISLLSLALGAVTLFQGTIVFAQLGQGQLIYPILIAVIVRELGPLLTAFIVAARSGTAMATELGNMVVSHEIEAYLAHGIDPIRYLAVPRVLGATISMVLLTVYFTLFGLLASFFVTSLLTTIDAQDYFRNLLAALRVGDILVSISKSLVSGFLIATVATYHGFAVNKASTEVPVMTIRSVGRGFTYVVLANAVITALYYVVTA